MAERHDVQHILKIARELVHKVQSLMDNKWPQRSNKRQRSVPSSRTLSSSSDPLTVFQASTHPEQIHWVQGSSLPKRRPWFIGGCVAEAAWLWSSASICLHSLSPGMPMVSVQTCGFVCMLCEFDHTVSAFLSPPHSLHMLLCVCMETHTNTHFDPIFSRSLRFFLWLWTCWMPVRKPQVVDVFPCMLRVEDTN